MLGPDLAHLGHGLQQKAGAVAEAAAIGIVALVAVGREKALRQIAVGKVQLQPFKAGSKGAAGCRDKVGLHAGDVRKRHGAGHARQTAAKGDGRWRNRLPAAGIAFGNMVVAFPGVVGAGLAPCMADLDAGHGACGLDAGGNARHAVDLGVVPQAGAIGRDAALGRHARGFDDHQPRAAARHGGVVNLVPVIGETVHGAVLAHRRNGDAVAQGQAFESERGKECRHAEYRWCEWKKSAVLRQGRMQRV